MPILNRDDAVEVEERISRVFAASPAQRAAAVRRLFVEVLDFNAATGQVSLAGAAGPVHLPAAAERVAELDGVHVLFVALPDSATARIRKTEVDASPNHYDIVPHTLPPSFPGIGSSVVECFSGRPNDNTNPRRAHQAGRESRRPSVLLDVAGVKIMLTNGRVSWNIRARMLSFKEADKEAEYVPGKAALHRDARRRLRRHQR